MGVPRPSATDRPEPPLAAVGAHDPDCDAGGTFEITWPFGGGKHDTKQIEWPDHNTCVRENKMPICVQRQMGARVRRIP